MKTSAQSFQDYERAAFEAMGRLYVGNASLDISHLYDCYKQYNPLHLPPKTAVAMAGGALNAAMVRFMTAVGVRRCRIQGSHTVNGNRYNWPDMAQGGGPAQATDADYRNFYNNNRVGLRPDVPGLARAARRTYLHVYPTVARAVQNNWRIGLNAKPDQIAALAARLLPIMDANGDIHHIKFDAPGHATKPDSIIIYMRKRAATYDTIKELVLDAVRQETATAGQYVLQPTFSPMWNEFAPGMAEAAEPPTEGGSFGNYRCIVTWLAYRYAHAATRGRLDFAVFQYFLEEQFLPKFGMSISQPHWQSPLVRPALLAGVDNTAFQRARALDKGLAAGAYAGRNLTDRMPLV